MRRANLNKLYHLSFIQRYLLLAALFALSLLPLLFFAITTYLETNHLLELEIQGNQYESLLKKLIDALPRHQNLVHRYLKGQAEVDEDLHHLNNQIDLYFNQLANMPLSEEIYIQPTLTPKDAHQKWKEFDKQKFNLSSQANDHAHQQLIGHIHNLFDFLGDHYYLLIDSDHSSTHLILSTLSEIPHLQSLLYQATYSVGEALFDQTFNPQTKSELIGIIKLLEMRLHNLKENITKAFQHSQNNTIPLNEKLLFAFNDYERSIQQLIESLSQTLLKTKTPSISREELTALGNGVITSGLKLWDLTNEEIDRLLTKRQENLRGRFWTTVLLSLGIGLLAFSLGLFLCLWFLRRLKLLRQAIENITDGHAVTRLPILYHDEIGRLTVAFNHLALRIEEIISQFHELLNGIRRLAEGDLSVRIQPGKARKEYTQVSHLFNQMAQTYEIIIGRLQQLGLILTNSADQIAAGSKEQEVIIVEQEATTREIAVAANEISSTAKEFANTLKTISAVAEQTSTLASAGKSSLLNMESIMRQMVDASSNIASKLAVLNEKASNITGVITTITKVADQTNLLSLNASIEAEKAGEYGRSFAVIAREIRRLADQTAASTLDIEKIVNEIMTAVSSSVMGVEDFAQEIRNGVNQINKVRDQLTTIMEQVQDFIARFDVVNSGMQAQSMGAEQINEAITQLSHTAQQTAQSIHQFHHTIEDLNAAANQLRLFTPHLKISAQTEKLNQSLPL